MAVKGEFDSIEEFDEWYTGLRVNQMTGALVVGGFSKCSDRIFESFRRAKSEMDARVAQYEKYERQASAEVATKHKDLPNISAGDNAGFIRSLAKNVVQHTPNVYINNEFDDESLYGAMARHVLKKQIIGDDEYSNDMQQHLIATARRGFTLGFDCVIPVLQQNARGSWYMQYDNIHYRDVFPEPGAKDIRQATEVFIRRYMTRGELFALKRDKVAGWDERAITTLLQESPQSREYYDYETDKHGKSSPNAYSIITYYSNSGDAFLTFSESSRILLRIEENKHPLKEHPVFFFVPESDDYQPFGKSLLSLTFGRQEFQDLYMNGVMKLLMREINPPIIGFGMVNAVPNLSPGAYTPVSNPNAKLEAFQINSQALMMFGSFSQQNSAGMIQLMGAADQNMAAQSTGGMMSQTPQGVEAQRAMVDTTTNNYQKAVESFFSKYCSYALTVYFHELSGIRKITPTADTREYLINGGLSEDAFIHEEWMDEDGKIYPADGTGLKDGELKINFKDLATEYYVLCVPGSLTELEDEKEIRILQELLVPISQAIPAIAQSGDQEALQMVSKGVQYIIRKQIELSGSSHSADLAMIFGGNSDKQQALEERHALLEARLSGVNSDVNAEAALTTANILQMQERIGVLSEAVSAMLERSQPGVTGELSEGYAPGAPASPESMPQLAPVAG